MSPNLVAEPVILAERKVRPCGHPEAWFFKLTNFDGKSKFYCYGCLVKKVGLLPFKEE